MLKNILFLIISLALTIVITFVQQLLSTYSPEKSIVSVNDQCYTFKLPVISEGNDECLIELNIPDTTVKGSVIFRLYNASDNWHSLSLIRMNDNLLTMLPKNKTNVKIEYFIELNSKGHTYYIAKRTPIIVRYQGAVPKYIQYPYVLILFLGMIMVCYTGFVTIFNVAAYKIYAKYAFYLILLGTVIFGTIVHLLSFRHIILDIKPYNDLTFYKYLIIFVLWLIVYQTNKTKDYRYVNLIVSIITLVVFCISQNYIFGWLY